MDLGACDWVSGVRNNELCTGSYIIRNSAYKRNNLAACVTIRSCLFILLGGVTLKSSRVVVAPSAKHVKTNSQLAKLWLMFGSSKH